MEDAKDNLERELDDLREELKNFEQEKERVRSIIGQIGGIPKFHTKLMNIAFIVVIIITLAISIVGDENTRLLSIEIATVALAFKIIYLIHCQMKINHFKFWILSSIEWRINEMMRQIRKLQKED